MEKLTCTSCGATMTPNTNQPYLVCEYCDSAMENKYYVEPANNSADELETQLEEELLEEEEEAAYEEEESLYAEEVEAEDEPTLIEKIIEAGKDLLTGNSNQSTVYTTYAQPVTHMQPVTYVQPAPPKPRPRREEQPRPVPAARPAKPAQAGKPSLQQTLHQRSDRPTGSQSSRPSGGRPSGGRPQGGGQGGRGGHGGRGGMGGPGRR